MEMVAKTAVELVELHTHTPLTVCLIILKFLEVIFWEHQAKSKQAGRQADRSLPC